MNRRSILKGLGILPFGIFGYKLIANQSQSKEIKVSSIDVFEYRKFKYFWSGYKHNTDSVRLFGQWIAINPENGIRIYSGSNGTHGQYHKGDSFCLTTIAPRQLIELDTADCIKEYHKSHALEDLILEINKYYEQKDNNFVNGRKSEYTFGFTGFKNA